MTAMTVEELMVLLNSLPHDAIIRIQNQGCKDLSVDEHGNCIIEVDTCEIESVDDRFAREAYEGNYGTI